jgi:hypothetical protein
MDYTKFLYGKNRENNSFKLNITNDYIKESIKTLKDIKKANYILQYHHKFNYKLQLDEYFVYFLKEKNTFINSFRQYILKSEKNPEITRDTILVYKEIISILKNNLDDLILNFKMVKQNLYKKNIQQSQYFDKKFNFFAENETNIVDKNSIESLKDIPNKVKKFFVKNLPIDIENFGEKIKNKYKEANYVIQILMDKEKQDYEKTKKIIFDLSSLVTSVQKKLYAQGEMAKNILFNSYRSVESVERGNKELKKAKEYQKGRGLLTGIIYIILGLFLIIKDR